MKCMPILRTNTIGKLYDFRRILAKMPSKVTENIESNIRHI